MAPATVGDQTFRIRTALRAGRWVACAARVDNGDRFGVEVSGQTEADAVAGVTRWLKWQRDHASALESLQNAQRAYHQAVAGQAFAGAAEEIAAGQARRDALERVDAARARLDAVRGCRPV